MTDITVEPGRALAEFGKAEKRREFAVALRGIFAEKATSKDYLDAVVGLIKNWSGCEAVGIRIVDERRDIPYESWQGFNPEFIEREHSLSLNKDNCCCIRAVTRAFEPQDRVLLTPTGSYVCADSLAFLKGLPAELQGRYRGNCMRFGYTSLAIIPVRARDEALGAVHLADSRPGYFAPALVEFIESLTPVIGEAIRRFHAERELARYRDQLELLVRQRTADLEEANKALQVEIAQRKSAEEALRQTARELERSNRDLEQFAYVASHDLQEPLRAVGGYVRLLQHRFGDRLDAKALEYIAGAAEGASRMQTLITDLLAFSRVGTHTSCFVPADLNELFRAALYNLQTSIQAANATVTSDHLPTLHVDASQVVQLLQNLIGNAIKFRSDRPAQVHVGCCRADGRWVLGISDNGIGIEPQYFERIFQLFQRLHTRKHYPGTGIGLALCKKIVERHGGEIWVQSALGQGSTFYFSLRDIRSGPDPT